MPSNSLHITLFHTNDMHGNLDGMARLSTLCRRLRCLEMDAGNSAIFMDAGDAADRKLEIVSNTKGAAFGQILNAMDYDVQALGNDLSLTYGPQCVPAYAARLNFPLLAANYRNSVGSLFPGVTDRVIFPLPGGVKLGVIGLTPQAADINVLFGIDMGDPIAILQEMASELRGEGTDILIVLSHSGLREDEVFAEAVPGVDLIIGGHSHSLLVNGEVVKDVLIAQAGEYAEYLGRVDIDYDPESRRILKRSSSVIPVLPEEIPDPLVLQAIAAAETEMENLINQPAAELTDPLELNYYEECSIGNFTADALRVRMNADAAIIHTGLFHGGLPAGVVSLGQLRKSSFSTANPAVTRLTGRQIMDALEVRA